jgi:3',5'-cyclic AMP phosphodiesterase CpdA
VLIAQITDTHIRPEGSLAYGHVDTSAFLARAVDHILHLDPRPDVVLGTGDLVDGGTPAEYARLRHLLSPLPWARPAGGAGRGRDTGEWSKKGGLRALRSKAVRGHDRAESCVRCVEFLLHHREERGHGQQIQ